MNAAVAAAQRAEAVRAAMRSWHAAGVVGDDVVTEVARRYPDDRRRAGVAFRVLLARSAMKGGVGLRCVSDAPRRAQALAFRKGRDVRALVFNLSPEPQNVLVAGLPLGAEALSLDGGRRAKDASSHLGEGYRLDLLPYEVVRLDARG